MAQWKEIKTEGELQSALEGSQADEFYEQCGYHVIAEMHGQNIYQKLL